MVAQSPEPGRSHVLNVRAFRIELEFRSVVFLTRTPQKKETLPQDRLHLIFLKIPYTFVIASFFFFPRRFFPRGTQKRSDSPFYRCCKFPLERCKCRVHVSSHSCCMLSLFPSRTLRFSSFRCFVFDLGCFPFGVLSASLRSTCSLLRASVFVFECFVFDTTYIAGIKLLSWTRYLVTLAARVYIAGKVLTLKSSKLTSKQHTAMCISIIYEVPTIVYPFLDLIRRLLSEAVVIMDLF